MKRNILITGIYGFIGANFAIYWNNHYPDDRIIGIDKMTYAANPANLDSIARHANMTCYRGDIADAAFVQSVFEKERPQWVVNFAAESHVDRSIENPELFIHSNVLGVSVLMDACLRFGVNKFHQVSTDEVYGDLPLESTSAFTEESALHPSTPPVPMPHPKHRQICWCFLIPEPMDFRLLFLDAAITMADSSTEKSLFPKWSIVHTVVFPFLYMVGEITEEIGFMWIAATKP